MTAYGLKWIISKDDVHIVTELPWLHGLILSGDVFICQFALANLGSVRNTRSLPWVHFLSFSCSFQGKFGQIIGWRRLATHPIPSSGKSWIRHWFVYFLPERKLIAVLRFDLVDSVASSGRFASYSRSWICRGTRNTHPCGNKTKRGRSENSAMFSLIWLTGKSSTCSGGTACF